MAYCVHCGVRLGDAESCCPLCGTRVIDPSDPDRTLEEKSFPPHTPEQKLTMSKRYVMTLLTIVCLVPAALCLLIDIMLGNGISWSIYPAVALTLTFACVVIPLYVKKGKAYWSVLAGFMMLAGYTLMCERLSSAPGWFFPVVLPTMGLGCIMVMILILLYNKKQSGTLTSIASILICIAILCAFIETLLAINVHGAVILRWSPFVIAPCVFLGAVLFWLNSRRPLREEVRRRMHF